LEKKVARKIMLTLLLISTVTLAFGIQGVKASGTIYIRSDGSIEPSTAPISTADYVTYTFADNINDSIVVERNNIIIDGDGYTLQGPGVIGSRGIDLTGRTNVTVRNTQIKDFDYGIWLQSSFSNSISGNNITANNQGGIILDESSNNILSGNNVTANNYAGIALEGSSNNNIIVKNNIANHRYGICLWGGFDNIIYHNNFDNALQVNATGSSGYLDVWDDGYPSGGNYWSDYSGTDTNQDGIGNTQYIIDAINVDRYPLMGPFNTFDAGTWNNVIYHVDVVSNSTISAFYFNPEGASLRFNVTGESGTNGFCRVTIPKDLLWVEDGWTVFVDDEPVDYTVIQDENCTYLYFNYSHSTKTVEIEGTYAVPEFSSVTILLLFLILTMLATVIVKSRILRKFKT